VDIANATNQNYTLTPSDGDHTVRLRVTGTNGGGSAFAESDPTDVVIFPPSNSALPTISGTTQQGDTLTGNQGTWSGTAPITFTY